MRVQINNVRRILSKNVNKADKETPYRVANWAIALVLAYGLAIAAILIVLSERGRPDWGGLVFSLGLTAIISGPVIRCLRTKISEEGIRGYNVWSLPLFVRWSEISTIKPINVGGLRYLRIFTEDTARPLWLPLFHQEQDDLEKSIMLLTPEHNILHSFIKTRSVH